MSIKRNLVELKDVRANSTVKLTQASNGILSGTFGIFWPLTADGTFGASISTPVTGYEYIFTDGTTATYATLTGVTKTGMTVTVVEDDKQNSKRIIKLENTGRVGIVQINVVQEDVPWYYSKKSDFERFEEAFRRIEELETRVTALETPTP